MDNSPSTPVRPQTAFITGAGSGMGKLYAERLLAAGWQVTALDVNTAGLEALARAADAGGRLLCLTVDITRAEAVSDAAEQAQARFGPPSRVVNAAAIMPCGALADQSAAQVHAVMQVNYFGLVNLVSAVLPGMLERRSGTFVSFASLAGHLPVPKMGAYHASKFAVSVYTEVLYQENRRSGVQFVCVCPPAVATPLLDQARNTVWPRALNVLPPIKPDLVLDRVDRAIRRKQFWVFPGPVTRWAYRLRHWMPGIVWWVVRKIERL